MLGRRHGGRYRLLAGVCAATPSRGRTGSVREQAGHWVAGGIKSMGPLPGRPSADCRVPQPGRVGVTIVFM
jgi:hypothetical protein